MRFSRLCLPVLALLAAPLAATAQDYPNRAIRMIVPLSPGGATDAMVRSVAPRMSATPSCGSTGCPSRRRSARSRGISRCGCTSSL